MNATLLLEFSQLAPAANNMTQATEVELKPQATYSGSIS